MAVCLLIVYPLEMHKHVRELRRVSNTLTYRSCVLFLLKEMVYACQRVILDIRKFV